MSGVFGDVVLTGDEQCANPISHLPTPRLLVHHHIKPESWGGSVAEGLALLCPTCHMNVHVLIDLFVKACGPPPWTTRRLFSTYVRVLAARAWEMCPATPTLTL